MINKLSSEIEKVKQILANLRSEFLKPNKIPEVFTYLDLESRRHDQKRLVKHIHQACLFNVLHFKLSNKLKLLYLIDSYLLMLTSNNPLGVYFSARGLLELNAFTHEVNNRLFNAMLKNENWEERGRQFFNIIIRARFGTTNPKKIGVLPKLKISKKNTDPLNIMNCIQNLSHEEGFGDIENHYDLLCDFVHNNLSSQTVSVNKGIETCEGIFKGSVVKVDSESVFYEYIYPSNSCVESSINDTLSYALKNAEKAQYWITNIPESSFYEEELVKYTGDSSGELFRSLPHSDYRPDNEKVAYQKKIGRNDLCICGSGKKYKKCCGA